jgi:hypothetical protein
MLVAGHSAREVSTALEVEGHTPLSPDHITRYYGSKPDIVKAQAEARELAVEKGVGERSDRVLALWKRARWIDESIETLSVAEVSPTVLKTLLSEFREYNKQVAQELGEWQERRDVTSAGRPITFNLSVLSADEVNQLLVLRTKLGP